MVTALFALFFASATALVLDTSKRSDGAKRCVVWHSQHKSGGQAITSHFMSQPLANSGISTEDWRACGFKCFFICDRSTWSCTEQRCVEPPSYQPYNQIRFAMRGYVQVLRGSSKWGEAGDGNCVWATMSREPIARLVSAYLYCRNENANDPLCGFKRLNTHNATLREFAEHWGNYLFRELLLFPDLRTLAESRQDFNPAKHCVIDAMGRSVGDELHTWQYPWLQFKDQLNGGDSIETASGKQNFQAVKDHLLGRAGYNPLYDVIGLLEEWQDTMFLFDTFMRLDGAKNWTASMGEMSGGTHNSWKYEDEENRVLEEARKDPVIHRAIAGDIALYNDVIVPLFHKQVARYKKAA